METPKIREQMITPARRLFGLWWAFLLCAALIVTCITTALVSFDKTHRSDLIIVLDPGHGGFDTGAINSERGLYESEINLKIALACRDRLNQYKGVRVYMTHTGVKNRVGKSALSSRVSVAQEVGADIFISLHINSAENKTANGAEIYVPATTHEAKYNQECTKLAEKIIANFEAIGLHSRGVKTRRSGGGRVYTFEDGTQEVGDYYYVVGEPISRMGIPGILVEHAFIQGDADYLDSDAELEALGIADADAIAVHYGLRLKSGYETVSSFSEPISSFERETSSEPPISSEPSVSSESQATSSEQYTTEDDEHSDIKKVEELIKALPDNPTENDGSQIKAARNAFNALGANRQNQVDTQLYQRYCKVITAYENLTHPIRIAVKEGSQLSIDRVNGRLLNVETAKQPNGKTTVFSVMLELELYLEPGVSPTYRQEGVLDYRIVSPDGKQLSYDDVLPENSVISIIYGDAVLDTLSVSY